jgi:hypothetical protein
LRTGGFEEVRSLWAGAQALFGGSGTDDGKRAIIFKTTGEAQDFLRKIGVDPDGMLSELDRTNAASERVSLPSRVIERNFS